ncbi:unnamed protein product [Calypogeia fissa]
MNRNASRSASSDELDADRPQRGREVWTGEVKTVTGLITKCSLLQRSCYSVLCFPAAILANWGLDSDLVTAAAATLLLLRLQALLPGPI